MEQRKITGYLNFRDAKIGWRNFEGREQEYNVAGNRNFCIFLDKETADRLSNDGWHIRVRAPREEGDDPTYYLQVKVSYDYYPPEIVLISGKAKRILKQSNIHMLDSLDIEKVDIVVRPYNWKLRGSDKTGVKAYLKSMYITQALDEFAKDYEDVPYGPGDEPPWDE